MFVNYIAILPGLVVGITGSVQKTRNSIFRFIVQLIMLHSWNMIVGPRLPTIANEVMHMILIAASEGCSGWHVTVTGSRRQADLHARSHTATLPATSDTFERNNYPCRNILSTQLP